MRQSRKLEEVAQAALRKWGLPAQLDQLTEECAELIHAVSKYKRATTHDEEKISTAKLRVADEIADVYIMLYQIERALELEELVDEIETKKLLRTQAKIAGRR
jgi:NTP pyrophosphatase (non-canonical NTP hydrolase)